MDLPSWKSGRQPRCLSVLFLDTRDRISGQFRCASNRRARWLSAHARVIGNPDSDDEKHLRYTTLQFLQQWVLTIVGAFFCAALPLCAQVPAEHKTQHIIFVMTDGLRWQEVFSGADKSLMNKKNGKVTDEASLEKTYWRKTPEARREALLPFVWRVMARRGQIFGNREKGSDAYVTNGLFFSYPGYSEILCGFADPRINSNDKVPNPNVTVLEWLKNRPSFQGEVAAFGAWDVIAAVFNPERSKLIVNAGYDPFSAIPETPQLQLLNHLKAETPRVWDDEPFDAIPFYTAVEYLKARKPRILYLSLGETDDWAHAGKYTEYLDSAHRVDSYLQVLCELTQSMLEYRDSTTLIFSAAMARKSPIPSTSGWPLLGQTRPLSASVPRLRLSPKIRLPPPWRLCWGKITRRRFQARGSPSPMCCPTEDRPHGFGWIPAYSEQHGFSVGVKSITSARVPSGSSKVNCHLPSLPRVGFPGSFTPLASNSFAVAFTSRTASEK